MNELNQKFSVHEDSFLFNLPNKESNTNTFEVFQFLFNHNILKRTKAHH